MGVLLVIILLLSVYFLPSIIALSRGVYNKGSVLAINTLLGWTLVGYVVALAMSMRTNPVGLARERRDEIDWRSER